MKSGQSCENQEALPAASSPELPRQGLVTLPRVRGPKQGRPHPTDTAAWPPPGAGR